MPSVKKLSRKSKYKLYWDWTILSDKRIVTNQLDLLDYLESYYQYV
jgi:hypothetical protein